MDKNFYIYILYSKRDKKLYVGQTNNLRQRMKRHNNGLVFSTKNRRPLILIHSEKYNIRKEAIKREYFLKSLWGGREKKKLLSNILNLGLNPRFAFSESGRPEQKMF